MPKPIKWFLENELLIKDSSIENLSKNYLDKARKNIVTMRILDKTNSFRDILSIPEDYSPDEWIVVTAYYSMYMAALSVLAKLGYKSKNHSATIIALEELFVKKSLLERKYLKILEKIKIKKEEIEQLETVRNRREVAQYSVTKETTRRIAEETMKEANEFVDRMEELYDLI